MRQLPPKECCGGGSQLMALTHTPWAHSGVHQGVGVFVSCDVFWCSHLSWAYTGCPRGWGGLRCPMKPIWGGRAVEDPSSVSINKVPFLNVSSLTFSTMAPEFPGVWETPPFQSFLPSPGDLVPHLSLVPLAAIGVGVQPHTPDMQVLLAFFLRLILAYP